MGSDCYSYRSLHTFYFSLFFSWFVYRHAKEILSEYRPAAELPEHTCAVFSPHTPYVSKLFELLTRNVEVAQKYDYIHSDDQVDKPIYTTLHLILVRVYSIPGRYRKSKKNASDEVLID